jgi:hypothetical protein
MGLVEISGYYSNLQQGLINQGLKADFYTLHPHVFKYKYRKVYNIHFYLTRLFFPENHWWRRTIIGNKLHEKYYGIIQKKYYQKTYDRFFNFCLRNYDVFIFGFGTSFYPDYSDYKRIKESGKKLICVFHGSDTRPPWMDGSIMAKDRGLTIDDCFTLTKKTYQTVRLIEKYADKIVCNPASAQFFSKPIINWFAIGVPSKITYNKRKHKSAAELQEKMLVLHSPSHPEAKGTPIIERAISELNSEGYNIELIKITGQPNHVVLNYLQKVDLVIDQLYSDTPLAGFAAEAISYSVPVVVGGFYNKEYQDFNDLFDIPPVGFIDHEKLKDEIKSYVSHPDDYHERVRRTQDYLEQKWNPKSISERFVELIEEKYPKEWDFVPGSDGYIYGGGMTLERLIEVTDEMIKKFGMDSLHLTDKTNLERNITKLINQQQT